LQHMKLLLSLFFTIISIALLGQPYQTGHRTVSFIDTARDNRVVTVELYYPAAAAGNNVPVITGLEKFPVVVFGHGFVIGTGSYEWLADSLTKNGYITALPVTESSFSPVHEQFGRDISFLCSHLTALDDSAGSFLYQRVIRRSAAGGHSMGGGASFLATLYNSSINAIFNFAAAETTPSAKMAASQSRLPALIFAGSRDCIVPDTTQERMYQLLPYPCKTFINITDALHCHFANNNGTCATGQFFSGCNNSPVTAAGVFQKTTALIIPFLDYYLKDSCSSKLLFEERLNTVAGIVTQRVCNNDEFVCPGIINRYTFTGNGNWSNSENWAENRVPPPVLPAGQEIIINPSGNNTCIVNISQVIAQGAKLIVAPGKNLLIESNLSIQ
jgi:dienelactone hydrolase